MAEENNHIAPRVRSGPIDWLNNTIRTSVETTVSHCAGYQWRIWSEKDLSEFAYHRTAIVSDGSFAVFLKYSETDEASRQFENESAGLQTLSAKAGVLAPQPLGIVQVGKGTLLILEALEAVNRGSEQWCQIGATLAQIHRVKGQWFGYEKNGFWGPLHQDNSTSPDWVTFYREQRLFPLLHTVIASGHIPTEVASRVERLATRLPELCGPDVTPTLLHGDAQLNNFINTEKGTYVIDPAVFFGHPEWDLALIDSWQPVPRGVFDGYGLEMPIDSGFHERRDLWRIPLYLAAVALEGSVHLNRLIDTLKRYE
jgi:protein-ribulosamine 3-kinase